MYEYYMLVGIRAGEYAKVNGSSERLGGLELRLSWGEVVVQSRVILSSQTGFEGVHARVCAYF